MGCLLLLYLLEFFLFLGLFLLVFVSFRGILALVLDGLVAVPLDFVLLLDCLLQFVQFEFKTTVLLLGGDYVVVDQLKIVPDVDLVLTQRVDFFV